MVDKEVSDTDTGIILNSGPDSSTSPGKDLTTHTRVMRLKQQVLEELLVDLKKLCIREAELTGKLSSDYPLLPDEKPPRVRRRIGATFKLDHSLIYQDGEDSELHSLETDLALQLQIVEAARRLSVEEHLSKPQKKSRLQQCNREERKVKDLQEAVFQHRIRNDCSSPPTNKKNNTAKHNLCMSDDSSLSDAVALDDDSLSSSSSVDPLIQSSLGSLSLQSSSSQGSLHHTSAQSQSLGSSCSVEQTQTQSQSLGSSCSVEQTQTQGSRMGSSCSVEQTQTQGSSLGSSCSVEQTQTQGSSLGSSCSVEQTQTQGSRMGSSCSVEFPERSPIQNSPWRESNLDQPYLKPNTPLSVCSSRPSTPVGTPVFPADSRVLPSHFPSIKNMALRHGQTNSSSAPSTPELHVRRQYSQSFRLPRSQSLMTWVRDVGEPGCHADGQSSCPPSRDRDKDNHKDREGPASTEIPKLCPPPYGFHYRAQSPTSPALNVSNSPSFYKTAAQILAAGPPPSSPRRVLKPPPPYTRLVRTPSLREYPNQSARVLPREMASELKSWNQRNQFQNQFQKTHPGSLERLGSLRVKSPTSPHLPPYMQGPYQKLILQRAADGTPVQWFVEPEPGVTTAINCIRRRLGLSQKRMICSTTAEH
ncbi:hypothetical protein J4Q44_G00217540 [Coregonus suidteri]|uniref:Cytohesin Ubiquitin Protein Inducing domain-containing protein n=1 Tax=Coregonus suidteri TaxID=861788 RepID=A0AAN8LDY1_9TELE